MLTGIFPKQSNPWQELIYDGRKKNWKKNPNIYKAEPAFDKKNSKSRDKKTIMRS